MRFLLVTLLFFLTFSLQAQNIALAQNYFEQGEFEKAVSIYEKAYEKNPRNIQLLKAYVEALQAIEDYATAEKVLLKQVENAQNHPQFLVALGLNYQMQNNSAEATNYFNKAINVVDKNPAYAYSIGREFQMNGFLDEAIATYTKALEKQDNKTFNLELANIYGEKGELQQMFDRFIDVLEQDPKLSYHVKFIISDYITEDKENEANEVLRKTLLIRNQQAPNVLYNEFLSWLYLNQKEYLKAFTQEKAIYLRSQSQNTNPMLEIGDLAAEENKTEEAKEIYDYVIEVSEIPGKKIYPLVRKLRLAIAHSKKENEVEAAFQKAFEYFPNDNFFQDHLNYEYAKFLAFKKKETTTALEKLNYIFENTQNDAFFKASVKMTIADIYLQQEKFNQALLAYSQVQKIAENTELAQEATFKIAKTSFYTGDFDWAKMQLKILKTATSKLIANDALHLNVLISTNTSEDSLQTALKKFAKADLLQFQENYDQALTVLDDLLTHHKGDQIEDDAWFKKAKILETQQKYDAAIQAYEQIKTVTQNSIYLDDVYFFVGKIYENHLQKPELAKENYERIIFDHQDSIYFTEAQKKYRLLRGDNIQ
ncbi:tetratricopeptide repeat protein [Mesonia sp. K7]|uniref:tetratricopeptide repeat protein n=1 Tax=Mesonia sp. K7 TaxID=2218606 RepID=UPI000DA8E4B9|nr:tetratricopeptide repeat protein [Mesonia sp. K7]PZD78501.1 hypothetical protein DNG35_05415 [Mesonia sp. K7]